MEIMDAVKRVTGVMRRWVEANPELAGRLMKIAAVVASVTLALGTLAIAMAAVLGPLALLRFGMKSLAITGLGRFGPTSWTVKPGIYIIHTRFIPVR